MYQIYKTTPLCIGFFNGFNVLVALQMYDLQLDIFCVLFSCCAVLFHWKTATDSVD